MNTKKVKMNKMIASVGVEATSGILNDLNGVDEDTKSMFIQDQASYTSYEDGCDEVLDYCMTRCNDCINELKELLIELKEQAEEEVEDGGEIKWIVWGIETDVSLGYSY